MSAKTEGLERWKAKVTSRLPAAARKLIKDANVKNATEFRNKLLSIIPTDEGDLAASVEQTEVGVFGAQVSEGSSAVPYPLHVEVGHKARDGSHVPAKPHWFPAKRVLKKRFKSRNARALSQAVKSITGGGK